MTLLVIKDFNVDDPDFAYKGFGKFRIPKGARLLDVTGPDRYGWMVFRYNDVQLKDLIDHLMEHSETEQP